jgi:hypothetical protein
MKNFLLLGIVVAAAAVVTRSVLRPAGKWSEAQTGKNGGFRAPNGGQQALPPAEPAEQAVDIGEGEVAPA